MPLDVRTAEAKEMFKVTMEFARLGIKAAFLLNGAAIIGLMTFLGDLSKSPIETPLLHAAHNAFPLFIVGVFSAAVTNAIAFFSQEHFYMATVWQLDKLEMEEEYDGKFPADSIEKAMKPIAMQIANKTTIGSRWRLAAILAMIISFVCFLVGSYLAYRGL